MDKNKKPKFAEKVRRDNEIQMYGRLLSLRPSVYHTSKKIYSRKNFKIEY